MKYGKFTTDLIKEALENGLPKGLIKSFWDGDPIAIPQSALPAIIIETRDADFDNFSTMQVSNLEEVVIKVLVNKKDDKGKASEQVLGHRTLKELVEGRDESDRKYLHPNSICSILFTNFSLTNNAYNQTITRRYGISVRRDAANRKADNLMYIAEAQITTRVEDLIEVPGRV